MHRVLKHILVMTVLFSVQSLSADPVSDATKLLQEEKYAEVEKVLEKELAKASPNTTALKLSIDAALAQGRIVTASLRITKLLKLTKNKDPELVFLGAKIAELAGDQRLAVTRYLIYVRMADAKNGHARKALSTLLRSAGYPEYFKRLATQYGKKEVDVWGLGLRQIDLLINQEEPAKASEVAQVLIKTYRKRACVEHLAYVFRREGDGLRLGTDPLIRGAMPLDLILTPEAEMIDRVYYEHFFNVCKSKLSWEKRFDYIVRINKKMAGPLWWNFVNELDHMRDIKDTRARFEAGKKYLELEPLYKNADDPGWYEVFLMKLAQSPQVFCIPGQPVIDSATFLKKYEELKALYAKTNRGINPSLIESFRGHFVPENQRVAFYRENMDHLSPGLFNELLNLSKYQNWEQDYKAYAKDNIVRKEQANFILLPHLNGSKDKANLLKASRFLMSVKPGDFDQNHLRSHFLHSQCLSIAEKCNLVAELIGQAGVSRPLRHLFDELEKDGNVRKDPSFKKLEELVKSKPKGTNPLMAASTYLFGKGEDRHSENEEVNAAVRAALASVKGDVPSDGREIKTVEQYLLLRLFDKQRSHCWDNRQAISAWAAMWAPRLKLGQRWNDLLRRPREHGAHKELREQVLPHFIARVKAGETAPWDIWWRWTETGFIGEGSDSPLFAADVMAKMPKAFPFHLVNSRRSELDRDRKKYFEIFNRAAKACDYTFGDEGIIKEIVNEAHHRTTKDLHLDKEFIDKLLEAWLARAKKVGYIDHNMCMRILELYHRAGMGPALEAGIKRYLEACKSRDALVDGYRVLVEQYLVGGAQLDEMVFNYVEELKAMPLPVRSQRNVSGHIAKHLADLFNKKDTRADACRDGLVMMGEMMAWGAPRSGDWLSGYWALDFCRHAAWEKKDLELLNRVVVRHASKYQHEHWNEIMRHRVHGNYGFLKNSGLHELCYAYLNVVVHNNDVPKEYLSQINVMKAQAAQHVPGLIPVDPKHPAYNLHLAAHAYGLGNESQAWDLASKKLKELAEHWTSLEPSFVAWCVEQMRKQKMLKQALELCFLILVKEQELEPAIAAQVSLVKGDVLRDQGNYQAARIEYESLMTAKRFRGTEAGRESQLHLIDLQITTGDYGAAEIRLERLVNGNDMKMQAEGYFYKAKIAFLQKDYQLSHEMLNDVFSRSHDHVLARLLEGELKLKLPRGLVDLEVAVGDKKLATIAIPGRDLPLKLQDTNLSIARGGSAIPVIVTTSEGGDEEHIKLFPSAGDRTLFIGNIATALGTVQKKNLRLEVRGDDVVSYQIDPEFQKANDLSYPKKNLSVRANGKMLISSGEILSEEEAEKRELEERMRSMHDEQSARFRGRSGSIVRPGSPIYAQVIDADRDLSPEPDTVEVDLRTSSGDELTGVKLTETGAHTGIFRGKVPTGIPAPMARASDTEEGKSPAGMINSTINTPWTSLAGGKPPKWVEVDTMSSHEVKEARVLMPDVEAVRRVTLMGFFDAEYVPLGTYPADNVKAEQGGMTVYWAHHRPGEHPGQMRHHLRFAEVKSYHQQKLEFNRDDTAKKGQTGWMTVRMKGAFYVEESMNLKMRFIHDIQPQRWQIAHVYVDDKYILGGTLDRGDMRATSLYLTKGVHQLEILMVDNNSVSQLQLGICKDNEDEFTPLPESWFDVSKHQVLKTLATVRQIPEGFVAHLDQPQRFRKLRWVFDEFTTPSLTVSQMTVVNSKDEQIIPVKSDFSSGLSNRILEISPGDQITCTYEDSLNLEGEGSRSIVRKLSSSFFNGKIMLANEDFKEMGNGHRQVYEAAKRCRAGTQLMVFVTDADQDLTDEPDEVKVLVETSSGEKLELLAMEHQPTGSGSDSHAGVFMAVVKFGQQTGGDTIKVSSGDRITVSYLDSENTNPGVPVRRSYTLFEVGKGEPHLTVYRTSSRVIEDTSRAARVKLERLRKHAKKGAEIKILCQEIRAIHPEVAENPRMLDGGLIPVSVNAPLLFTVAYPQLAIHEGSVMKVTLVAESELKLSEKEGRKADECEVTMYLRGIEQVARVKGYSIAMLNYRPLGTQQLLEQGLFAGVVRLQLGQHGDRINDLITTGHKEFQDSSAARTDAYSYKVPTLLVAGSDVVQIRVKSLTSGKAVVQRVKLLADARLQLLDSTYTYEKPAIHLGEKMYIRVTDPDHDIGEAREKLTVEVNVSSGASRTLTLEETLPHSGVFTGSIEPVFATNAKPGELAVTFGDSIAISFVDKLALSSADPITIKAEGRVLPGADGEQACFTKRFKDPEVAVKTRFLMAEALFEMAKDHRKLKKITLADTEIARGKRILEEAMRDYPHTNLAAQGEYLLANLAQELGKYQEAIGRYANVISHWPESEYAARSQFKKAICLEKLENYKQATEEYVKLTYLYPDSSLVSEATIRLGNYFYKNKKYETASKVFHRFQVRNPNHRLAVKALFLSAQCQMRLKRNDEAARLFASMLKAYPDADKTVRAEGMYWLAESYSRAGQFKKAYQQFKKLTWDYPEDKWAKIARGRLTEDRFAQMDEE